MHGSRVLLAAALALASGPARSVQAHVVYGTPSLHELARDADVVVRVRVSNAGRLMRVEQPPVTRSVIDAVVLETLRGPRMRAVTFAAHGHGAARYHDGEDALIFLRRLDRVPELAATPLAGRVRWVSLQETSDKVSLDGRTRRRWMEAVRRYVAAEATADPVRRQAALRETTVALLASPEPRIASAALRDLVRAGDAPLVTRDDLPRLDPLLDGTALPMRLRIGLLAELERRGLVDAAPRWARLVREGRGSERMVAVRAAGTHPSPAVTAALLESLAADEPEVIAAAAVSLGTPGNQAAIGALERLLASDDGRIRAAAIRGLGRIGGGDALSALRRAAEFHPDYATRRRAGAEAVLAQRGAAPAGS